MLARGAALRFMLTRLVDWLNVPPGALVQAEGPAGILPQAALPRARRARLRLSAQDARDRSRERHGRASRSTRTAPAREIPARAAGARCWSMASTKKTIKGGEPPTTNNRMELMAAIMALEALKRPCVVDLWTDSQYVRQGITTWLHGWKRNGWKTADKKPVKNDELWQRLDAAWRRTQSQWHWVKGHAGHPRTSRSTGWPARAWRRSCKSARAQRPDRAAQPVGEARPLPQRSRGSPRLRESAARLSHLLQQVLGSGHLGLGRACPRH